MAAPQDDFPDLDDEELPAGEGSTAPAPVADAALLNMRFEDLPMVREIRAKIAERGYPPDDPVHLLVDVAAIYDARCQALTQRQVHLFASLGDQISQQRDDQNTMTDACEDVLGKLDAADKQQAQLLRLGNGLLEQAEVVMRTSSHYTPFLERASKSIETATNRIEAKSLKAIFYAYCFCGISLATGLLLGACVPLLLR